MFSAQILHVTGIRQVFNYGSDKVRFTNPVPVGSRVRARQTCLSVTAKPAGKQMIAQTSVEIEGRDKPALVAETISLFVGM
jgi:acyl dehydratase